jgi:hypothetical protein
MTSTSVTVAEYVVNRLADLGIDRVFGAPGVYTFPFDDAIESCDRLQCLIAQELGKKSWYESYTVQICEVKRQYNSAISL